MAVVLKKGKKSEQDDNYNKIEKEHHLKGTLQKQSNKHHQNWYSFQFCFNTWLLTYSAWMDFLMLQLCCSFLLKITIVLQLDHFHESIAFQNSKWS